MNKNKYCLSFLASLAVLPLQVSADSAPMEQQQVVPLSTGEPLNKCNPSTPGYFYPAEYKLCDHTDLFVTADFLYWSHNQMSGTNVLANRVRDTATTEHSLALMRVSGYRPAFKVGVGTGLPGYDNWKIEADYIWYHHKTGTNFSAEAPDVIIPYENGAFTASHLKSTFKTQYNIIDLKVGRPFYLSRRLIIDPFFGIRGFWTTDTEKLRFNLIPGGNIPPGSLFVSTTIAKFWGIGPHVGFDLKGLIKWGVYLVGKSAFTVAYQKTERLTHISRPLSSVIPFQVDSIAEPKFMQVQSMLDSSIGLGWGDYFGNRNCHFDFAVTYDYIAHLLIGLNNIFVDYVENHYYFQGLTFKAQLNF